MLCIIFRAEVWTKLRRWDQEVTWNRLNGTCAAPHMYIKPVRKYIACSYGSKQSTEKLFRKVGIVHIWWQKLLHNTDEKGIYGMIVRSLGRFVFSGIVLTIQEGKRLLDIAVNNTVLFKKQTMQVQVARAGTLMDWDREFLLWTVGTWSWATHAMPHPIDI